MSSALEVIFYNEMRYINLRFTYLLTYFTKFHPDPIWNDGALG